MTREEQRKLKELKKALPGFLKEKRKNYKFKKKDYMIWYNYQEMFFDLLINVGVMPDGRCFCSAIETLKPLWLDDLLWDFLKMRNNKEEPLSLRAIGAFTVYGSEIYKGSCELKNWEIFELEKCVDTYLEHFYQSIQSVTMDDFISNIENTMYHKELREALTFIYNHKYIEAYNCLNETDGVFINGEISINKEIRMFCRNMLK